MSRYQPPHMRQRPPASTEQHPAPRPGAVAGGTARPPVAGAAVTGGSTGQSGPSSAQRWGSSNTQPAPLPPSRRDWSSSPSSFSLTRPFNPMPIPATRRGSQDPRGGRGLASPAGDIKPMRAGAGGVQNKAELEMEMMQSVSRSGGDGAEGDALKSWETQERYRAYIDQRVDAHYTKFSTPRHTVPSIKGKAKAAMGDEEMESLGSIVLLFRKLREGVVASSRIGQFAIDVFESSARFAILAQNRPQLLSALSGLVPGLYQALAVSSPALKGGSVDKVADELASLDISKTGSDTRAESTSLLLLYHLVCSGRTAYQELLWDLTAPRKGKLRARTATANGEETSDGRDEDGGGFVDAEDLGFVLRAAQVLAEETFSPIAYFALISPSPYPSPTNDAPPRGSPYERALLAWAARDVRLRSWNVLRKAYLSVSLEWAGQALGLDGSEVEGWMGEHAGTGGGMVEGGMVKLR
ncbi:hypothetical protein IAT38_000986 [Cryptococcus sp. DSM 104549]